MKNLLYYIPHRLLTDESIELSPVNRSFLKMFYPWISLSDRTGTLDIGEQEHSTTHTCS